MVTREDLWIGDEVLKFTNIIHDCLDACRYLLSGIEPDTGVIVEVPSTLDINERVRSHSRAAVTNKAVLVDFISKVGAGRVEEILISLNVDPSTITADVRNMGENATYIYNNVLKGDHTSLVTYLNTNLPKFVSVRRRWVL